MNVFFTKISGKKSNDVRSDEESLGGGAFRSPSRSSPPITSSSAAPTLVGDGHTKINAGASPPHFWVAPPRKGVGPARMRRREAMIHWGTREPPPFLTSGTHQSMFSTLIIVKETFNEKHLRSNLIGMPYFPVTTKLERKS